MPEQGAVLENKKGDSISAIPCEMDTKKAKVSLINRTPLPVTVLSYYREKDKTYPISNRAIITLILSSTPSSVLSVARNPLALPLVD